MENLHLGLDIGGQSIKGIALDGKGRVVVEYSLPTPAKDGAEAVLSAIERTTKVLAGGKVVSSVGVGTPGGVDKEGRVVGMSANISGWYGTPLGERIRAMAGGAPTAVRNDGNIAAYAEWAIRRDKGKILLFIGLGTGIGGGYVVDGDLLGGRNDRAVEIGHFVIEPGGRKCVCGASGCAEAYASGPSMGRIAMDLGLGREAGLGSLAAPIAEEELKASALARDVRQGAAVNAREVYVAFESGDPLAVKVDEVATQALARMTATALALLAPDTVVLGGGVVQGASHLLKALSSRVPALVYRDAWTDCAFEEARLGSRAGLMGAAWYGASRVMQQEALFDLIGGAGLR